MTKFPAAILAAAVLLGGCATGAQTAAADSAKEERVYTTGSNIPKKQRSGEGVVTMSPEDFAKARDAASGVRVGRGS